MARRHGCAGYSYLGMCTMEIRAAEWSDLGCVVQCEAEAFALAPRTHDGDVAKAHTVLAAQIRAGEIYVVTKSGRVLGYVSFATNCEHLFIGAIAVLPAHQRQGVGSCLLAFAELAAVDRELDFVSLYSDGMIAANTRFYVHRGYRETDRCDGPGFLRIYYSKDVPPVTARAA